MPWIVCLGHPTTKKQRGKASDATPSAQKHITFSIVERVSIHNAVHASVWEALRKAGNRQLVIDAEHPEEAFPADVLNIADIKGDILESIETALSNARTKALDVEKTANGQGSLAKVLDRTFDEQREWLALRTLLVAAVIRPISGSKPLPKSKRKAKCALLLVDA